MKTRTAYLAIAALLVFVPLAGLAYLGSFTRFYADDFCMATDAVQLGLGGMLAKWYAIWTGRFSFLLGTGLLGLGGPKFAGWLPAIVGFLWLAALGWAALPLLRRAGLPQAGWLSALAGGLVLLVVFSTTPNLFQSFFWQDGMVNYSLPLIGLTLTGGILLRTWQTGLAVWPAAFGTLLLAFVSGGFTEVFSAMQAALFVLAIAVTLLLAGRSTRLRLLPALAAALAGGLAAMAIILVAPGNEVRRQAAGYVTPGLVRIITFSLRNAAYIAGKYLIWTPLWALLSAAVPFMAGWLLSPGSEARPAGLKLKYLWAQTWFRGTVLILLAAFGLVWAACAPVVYALNAYPDDRTIIVPQFVLVVGVVAASTLLGGGLRRLGILPDPLVKPAYRRALEAAILVALVVASASSLWKTIVLAPNYQAYTQAWDLRSAELEQARTAGQSDVIVRGLENRFGVADLSADRGFWVNSCMASYYDLKTLTGR